MIDGMSADIDEYNGLVIFDNEKNAVRMADGEGKTRGEFA